ncbi:MAG: phage tail tape measure protein [Xanthobacteraceae bacterium]
MPDAGDVFDDGFARATESGDAFAATVDQLSPRIRELERSAGGFARAMTSAFTSSVIGGKQFDDVLKTLALRISDMALKAALAPITQGLSSSISGLFSGLFGGSGPGIMAARGAIKPFAAGGVIGTPTYFPLTAGGLGLAGEAGPEAIVPLARGPDGRLGVAAAQAGGGGSVTINIATPDPASFRGSEVYLTGQIARAVARGQRGL